MKKIIITATLLLSILFVKAQYESRYDFGNAPPILEECTAFGIKVGKKFNPPSGSSFKITSQLNSDTLIATCLFYGDINNSRLLLRNEKDITDYFDYNCNDEYNKKYPDLKKTLKPNDTLKLSFVNEHRLYFLIKASDLQKFSSPFYTNKIRAGSFVFGTQAKLLKIRLKEFDFSDDFSLSTTFGFRFRSNPRKDNFLNLVSSIGISLNNLDTKVASKIYNDTAAVKNIGALTVGIGVIKEFKNIQFSIMLGKDFLSKSNQKKYDWIYQGKTWLSIGIGVGIFTANDGKKSSTSDQQQK